MIDQADWEAHFRAFLKSAHGPADVAHDAEHIRRVVANARYLAAATGAALGVVLPAAWLHDCVPVAKDSPLRRQASAMAARTAGDFLRTSGYAAGDIDAIEHAIEAHSFSAGIAPRTLEAQVVQDADRLDALGAVGIARCLMLGGAMGKPLYDAAEPLPVTRPPDDGANVIDHFYCKLLGLAATMQTAAGRAEAARRTAFMQAFLDELNAEVRGEPT